MPCIGYVCVTQHKDPKEELLSALLGASLWNATTPVGLGLAGSTMTSSLSLLCAPRNSSQPLLLLDILEGRGEIKPHQAYLL